MYYGQTVDAELMNAAAYVPPPVPKRAKRGKCPLEEHKPCVCGNNCRFIRKNCLWQQVKRLGIDYIYVWTKKDGMDVLY